jgi:hypothetical protein
MTRNITLILLITAILYLPGKTLAQAPNIANASNFTVFTGSGALTSVGVTTIQGNIGTHSGSISGTATYTGQLHINDQASIDAETDLTNIFSTFSASGGDCQQLTTPFGNSAILTAGTYCLGSAGVLTGDLTLDGNNNPNAIFVFNIGGDLTATNANIILTNSASWSNVYFIVNGVFNLNQTIVDGAPVFRGNVITNGAINPSSGALVQGRLLSTAGAISLLNNQVYLIETPLPVTLTSFTVSKAETQNALLNWATTAETNSERFEIEHSTNGKIWKQLGSVDAKGESSNLVSYQYTDTKPVNGTNLYRLKMIDRDATFAYSRIQSAEFSIASRTVLYPNPVMDYLTVSVDDISQIQRIQISNIIGSSVFDKTKTTTADMSDRLDVKNLPSGLYFVRVTSNNGYVALSKIVKQ